MKQNLNEEINRIKMLLYINESNVILEANPILNIISKLAPALETKLITSIEKKLAKQITSATDTEITTALKSAEMAAIRTEIAEAIYLAEKRVIDPILSKYNMSIPGEATAAYNQLSAQGYNRAILKDINKAYKAGKTSGGAGTSTGGNVGSSVANIAIDLEGYLTKYFPNITSDKNIYSSLVNEIKPKLSNLDTKGQIDFITNKCTSLEKQIGDNLQNLTDMDNKESAAAMKKASSILKVIKEKLKKYGPVSFTRTDKVNVLYTIPRTLAWIEAVDILVLGTIESRKTGENLADTMFKRAGDRASFILGLFIGSTPEKSTQPEKEKIEY